MPGFSYDGIFAGPSLHEVENPATTEGTTMETLKYLGERVLVLVDPAQNNGGRVAPAQITRVNEDETVNVSITLDVAGATGYAAHIPIVANLTEALATQEDSPVLNIAFWPADDDTPDAVADRAPADDQQRA